MKELAVSKQAGFDKARDLVLKGVPNPNTRRSYKKSLDIFLDWYQEQRKVRLDKSCVLEYRVYLLDQGIAPSTVNLRISAVRVFVNELIDNGYLDPNIGAGVQRVKGVIAGGVRTGKWLTKREAKEVINAPDTSTLIGLRNKAILAVAIGAGLRRSEIASLTVEHINQIDGRWAIVDIVGKRNKIRTVPITNWTQQAINDWLQEAGITEGLIFRSTTKGGVIGKSISSQAIRDVIFKFASVPAHDLRRTYSKLAHKGGCPIEQIQLSLGHASIKTTEKYLGIEQDFSNAPADYLHLRLQ